MKDIVYVLWLVIIAIVFLSAVTMAIMDRDGWGWFLFVALLLASGFNYETK